MRSPSSLRTSSSRWPWWTAGTAAAGLLVAGLIWALSSGDGTPRYRTEAVTRGSLEHTVSALGSLQPKEYVDVGAQVSGLLSEVHVDVGQQVRKGDLLADIDPTLFQAAVEASQARLKDLQAQLAQQEAELLLARQTHQRYQALAREKAVSQELLESSDAQLKVATARLASLHAQIEQAESTLKADQANLDYCRIYATMDGTVVSQTSVEGQTLNARQTAPIILRIANLATMTVEAEVAEADITKLRQGMPVYFTTLGDPDRRRPGTVRQILPTPEIVNDVVLFKVLVDVPNADGTLMSDMTAQVFFVLGSAEDALLAPMTGLKPGKRPDEYRAQVLEDGTPVDRQVRVGLSNRRQAQVLDGLKEGEQVIVGEAAAGSTRGAGSNRGAGGPPMGPRL